MTISMLDFRPVPDAKKTYEVQGHMMHQKIASTVFDFTQELPAPAFVW